MKVKGNKEKEKIRATKEWRIFRKELIEERGTYCQCCGKKTKLLQCHHKDKSLENYANFDKENFFLLCAQCHKCVTSLEQIKKENWYKIRNPKWVDLYKDFLV